MEKRALDLRQKQMELQMQQWMKDQERLQRLDSFNMLKFSYDTTQDSIRNQQAQQRIDLYGRTEDRQERQFEHDLSREEATQKLMERYMPAALPEQGGAPVATNPLFPGDQSPGAGTFDFSRMTLPTEAQPPAPVAQSPYGPPSFSLGPNGISMQMTPQRQEAYQPAFTPSQAKNFMEDQPPGQYSMDIVDPQTGARVKGSMYSKPPEAPDTRLQEAAKKETARIDSELYDLRMEALDPELLPEQKALISQRILQLQEAKTRVGTPGMGGGPETKPLPQMTPAEFIDMMRGK